MLHLEVAASRIKGQTGDMAGQLLARFRDIPTLALEDRLDHRLTLATYVRAGLVGQLTFACILTDHRQFSLLVYDI